MTLGQKLKSKREELGLTQGYIAKKVGVATQTIFKYENEIVTNILLDRLELLADALNVTPAYLMGWEETTIKKNDTITDIILQIRSDEELLELVKGICNLPEEQRSAVQTFLSAFNKSI